MSCPRTIWTIWTIISGNKLILLEDKWYYQNIPPDRHPQRGFGLLPHPEGGPHHRRPQRQPEHRNQASERGD